LLIAAHVLGVKWFELGDFGYREAMYYHGIGISAWMLLILVSTRTMLKPLGSKAMALINFSAVTAGLLAGVGGALIRQEGLSQGTPVMIAGMVLADITAWLVIILFARDVWFSRVSTGSTDKLLERYTLIIALVSMSLATPLGHLAGMVQDFGQKFSIFSLHVAMIGAKPDDVLSSYITSHSHEVLAAFFVAVLLIPIISDFETRKPPQRYIERVGLVIVLIATVAQTAIYQYSACLAWGPPTLFESGPNGMPLDDVALTILGVGILMLLPTFFYATAKKAGAIASYQPTVEKTVAFLFLTYIVSVLCLGVYIEFHEGFFGGGESTALGGLNDLAFIRGHLLFGFMILPVLLVGMLSLKGLIPKKVGILASLIAILTAVLGSTGMYFWTFHLDATVIKWCYGIAVLSVAVIILALL
jgi:hypothetical protein